MNNCFSNIVANLNVPDCHNCEDTEAVTRCILCKKVFLEISQNSQENICVRVSFLKKSQALDLELY